MPVKPSQSGSRILTALERIARHQPIGVSELARALKDNLPATQRAIATLAVGGWIKAAPGTPTRWILSSHIHSVAQYAHGSNDLLRRARPALEELRRQTGESVLLNVPESGRFVVIEVLESPHYLRTTAPIGLIVPPIGSATALALLPFMRLEDQARYIGHPADAAMCTEFAVTAARGYAISKGGVISGSTNLAAPVFEAGEPVAAVLISAPTDRMTDKLYGRLGARVAATARQLSSGAGTLYLPAPVRLAPKGKVQRSRALR